MNSEIHEPKKPYPLKPPTPVYIFHEAYKDMLGQVITDRRTFVVAVSTPTDGAEPVHSITLRIGIARCSTKDHFSRKIGRNIAMNRAFGSLRAVHKGPNWDAAEYFMLTEALTCDSDLRDDRDRFAAIRVLLSTKFGFRSKGRMPEITVDKPNE